MLKKSLSGSFGVLSIKPYITESLGSEETGFMFFSVSVDTSVGNFLSNFKDFLADFLIGLSFSLFETT